MSLTGAAGGQRQPPRVQQRELVCIRAPRACQWMALTNPEQLRSGGSLCLDEQRWIAKPAEERRAAAPTPEATPTRTFQAVSRERDRVSVRSSSTRRLQWFNEPVTPVAERSDGAIVR
eukprot:CAMPEP_0185342816 /NCGR_PEP_ID=MMETSP1363-20130426/99312_1 /TAXON_ID=38817 /ORGANISM="Gephyrocapsa oceanica, Strain RCC1303" /LENGTH=117 /DNA_ID=CAMNT_0027942043 /DNA_START=693 /DNA_END=1045 /DNA_ORIENTATION=-